MKPKRENRNTQAGSIPVVRGHITKSKYNDAICRTNNLSNNATFFSYSVIYILTQNIFDFLIQYTIKYCGNYIINEDCRVQQESCVKCCMSALSKSARGEPEHITGATKSVRAGLGRSRGRSNRGL